MKNLSLLFILTVLTAYSYSQGVKKYDLTNLNENFEYLQLVLLQNLNESAGIYAGIEVTSSGMVVFELNNQTFEANWAKKFPSGSSVPLFTDNRAVFNTGSSNFIKIGFSEFPPINNSYPFTLSFGEYNNLVPDNSNQKYYENTISEHGYIFNDLVPVISMQTRLGDGSFLVGGNLEMNYNPFERSSFFPTLTRISNNGTIQWSKSYELADKASFYMNNLIEINNSQGIVCGEFEMYDPQLQPTYDFAIANIDLTNGDLYGFKKYNFTNENDFVIFDGAPFVFTVNNEKYVAGIIHYFDGGPQPNPEAEYINQSFIAKIDDDFNPIWFKHYSGVIDNYVINEDEESIVAIGTVVSDVTTLPVIYGQRLIKIDLGNEGEIAASLEIESYFGHDYLPNSYIYEANDLYIIGYSDTDEDEHFHHIIETASMVNFEGCEIQNTTNDFYIVSEANIFETVVVPMDTTINNIFTNNTENFSITDFGLPDDFLFNPTEICATVLNTDEVIFSQDIEVYPNPVSNKVIIDTKSSIDKIEIIDIDGKRILLKEKPAKELDVSHLPRGVYVLRVFTENRGILTFKLIK